MIKFVPRSPRHDCALYVGVSDAGPGYVFQCIDRNGEAQAETFHGRFADALAQATSRMRTEEAYHGPTEYTIELGD